MRNQTSRTHTYRYNKTKGIGVNWTNFIRARAVGFGAVEETNTLNLSLERFVKQLDKASRDEALKKCDGMKIDPSFGHVEGHSEVTLRVATSMFNEFIVSRTKRKSQMLILWGRISLRSSEIKILDDRTLRIKIPPYVVFERENISFLVHLLRLPMSSNAKYKNNSHPCHFLISLTRNNTTRMLRKT